MIRGELILESSELTMQWTLSDGEQVLGRSHQADLVLPLPVVSRQQLRIHCNEEGCWVTNLSTTNPTYLMGKPVVIPTLLRDGDLLGIGRLRLRFRTAINKRPSSPLGFFVIQQIGRPDRTVPLHRSRVVIGRNPRCELVLDYPAISRQHLLLEWQPQQGFSINTINSDPDALPPIINGKALEQSAILKNGDVIWLGDALGNGVTLAYLSPPDSPQEKNYG
jgi:pSer/pThr/pTyr-binding forkhead associated (FHA) protein